jgi:hypothetical protein
MNKQATCDCDKPILRERSEWKGASESYCDRCKLPLKLKTAKRAA